MEEGSFFISHVQPKASRLNSPHEILLPQGHRCSLYVPHFPSLNPIIVLQLLKFPLGFLQVFAFFPEL
jgi:hypothetical protein